MRDIAVEIICAVDRLIKTEDKDTHVIVIYGDGKEAYDVVSNLSPDSAQEIIIALSKREIDRSTIRTTQ